MSNAAVSFHYFVYPSHHGLIVCRRKLDVDRQPHTVELRFLSEVFAPKIRALVPDSVWRSNVSMNLKKAVEELAKGGK